MSAVIRPAVIEQWYLFSEKKEGRVPKMYLDTFGYVTTGVGNLINDLNSVLRLPWKRADGSFASPDEVKAEWSWLKTNPTLIVRGKSVHFSELAWTMYASQLKLHLDELDIDELVNNKRQENADFMKHKYFPMWDDLCADAQMFMLSMSWAVGPGWPKKFGNLTAAILRGDWGTYDASVPYKDFPRGATGAVACAQIRDGLKTETKADDNPGIVPRNKANFVLLHNVGVVVAEGLDPGKLYGPTQLQRGPVRPEQPARFSDQSTTQAEILAAQEESLQRIRDDSRREGLKTDGPEDGSSGTKKRKRQA